MSKNRETARESDECASESGETCDHGRCEPESEMLREVKHQSHELVTLHESLLDLAEKLEPITAPRRTRLEFETLGNSTARTIDRVRHNNRHVATLNELVADLAARVQP